jgi:hypothetical protein
MIEQKNLLVDESVRLATLRDTLLPRLMSGEIVTDDNIEV